jgi:hydroxymethylpyrimidine/phosphomethylpyrimidine kinase
MKVKKPCVLTIAGSDPSGGAGIQSDLKTFRAHGVYGLSVITSLTSQNTLGVQSSFEIPAPAIRSQLESILADFKIAAVKTGMLSSEKVIRLLAPVVKRHAFPLIIDPVILSKNGYPLLNRKGIVALKKLLIPVSYLVTPNFCEAEVLADMEIRNRTDIEIALKKIHQLGCKNILLKGGHTPFRVALPKGTDVLYNGKTFTLFAAEFINTRHTHGIGCTLSAAITANIALGKPLKESIKQAKRYVINLLHKGVRIGKGISPVEQ